MEDSHIHLEVPSVPSVALVAICDGHGGDTVARKLADPATGLGRCLAAIIHGVDPNTTCLELESLPPIASTPTTDKLVTALPEALLQFDRLMHLEVDGHTTDQGIGIRHNGLPYDRSVVLSSDRSLSHRMPAALECRRGAHADLAPCSNVMSNERARRFTIGLPTTNTSTNVESSFLTLSSTGDLFG